MVKMVLPEKNSNLYKEECDLSLSRCQNKSKSNFPPSMINIMSQPLGNNQRAKITLITTRQIHVSQGQGHGFSDGHGHSLVTFLGKFWYVNVKSVKSN